MRVPKLREIFVQGRFDPIKIPEEPAPRLPVDRFIPSPDLGPEPEFHTPRLPIDMGEDWPSQVPRWPTSF